MSSRARAHLKVGCPYSFKFLLFMSEARLLDRIDIVRCDPDDDAFERIRAKLTTGLGKPATFPTVEIEPGRYLADSDRLIDYFARKCGVAPTQLIALSFYKESIGSRTEAHEGERRRSHRSGSATFYLQQRLLPGTGHQSLASLHCEALSVPMLKVERWA